MAKERTAINPFGGGRPSKGRVRINVNLDLGRIADLDGIIANLDAQGIKASDGDRYNRSTLINELIERYKGEFGGQ